jgi:hypothetical protein
VRVYVVRIRRSSSSPMLITTHHPRCPFVYAMSGQRLVWTKSGAMREVSDDGRKMARLMSQAKEQGRRVPKILFHHCEEEAWGEG